MDRRGAFVDRPVPIAVFERLYLRDDAAPGPLPIVVLYGPGGIGKSRLLDYLYSRAKDPLTCARVRVNPGSGPSGPLELLDSIQEELAADPHPQCGLISFPRYELGRWMRTVAADLGSHPDREEVRARFKMLLNRRFRAPGDAGHAAQNILVVILQWLVELLLPAFLTRPSIIRRLLWGKHRDTGFVWYERHQRDIELPRNRDAGDIIRAVCALMHSADPADREAVEGLMLSAFLDDLRAAYDPDGSPLAHLRTTYCVALIDDIDLLPDARGFRLLELLAERRTTGRGFDPLLLVVTSSRWWHAGGPPPRPTAAAEMPVAPNPSEDAEDLHMGWLDALRRSWNQGAYPASKLYLPLVLPSLARAETRRLVLPGRRRARTATQEVLAEEIFPATHGHPLAIHLVKQAMSSRRPGAPRLAVRRLMEEPLPSSVSDKAPAESIKEHLLSGLLEPLGGRLGRHELAACATPRALDLTTLHAVFDLPDTDSGRLRATEVWEELAHCAFTQVARDGRLVLHPLLRDLLVREVAEEEDQTGQLSYTRTHARLADHFSAVAPERPEAAVDRAYHELALGRAQSVLRQLDELVRRDDATWREEFLAVARAPSSPHASGRVLGELRERARAQLRRRDDSLTDLLDRARDLYSPTSDLPWHSDLLEELDEVRDEVEGGGTDQRRARAGDPVLQPFDPAGAKDQGDDGGRPLLRSDEDNPFSCPVRPSRRGLRRAATAVALLAPILAYVAAYLAYAVETCGPAGPFNVWTVIADRVADDGVYVRHQGPRGEGPCIGITDGDGYVFSDTSGPVQQHIAEENAEVLRVAAETGRPYVTAVAMTALTDTGSGSTVESAGGRSELEGVYLAQRRYNRAGHVPMLRVLVANSGAAAAHANPVARQIVRAAERDSTIVSVVGLGRGTSETLRAATILGDAGLPVIASAASSDAFRQASTHFYRVAAPNERQAAVAAEYAKRALTARTAVVVSDPTDEYSRNLAGDFVARFEDREHRIVWRGSLTYDASESEVTNVLYSQIARACLRAPDLIFYAGRAAEADTLLAAMADAPCDPSVPIVGGHDLSLLAATPTPSPRPEVRNPFYYTAMAAGEAWQPERAPRFFDDHRAYLAEVGMSPTADGTAGSTHAALAYDATNVLTAALARSRDAADVDPFMVWRSVRLTTGSEQLHGAAGTVDFGAQPDGDPRRKAVLLMTVEEYGDPRLVGTCGQLSEDPDAAASPPERIPCPND